MAEQQSIGFNEKLRSRKQEKRDRGVQLPMRLTAAPPAPGLGPHSPPTSMVHMEKIFSESVFAETLPNPTLVKLLRAK